MVLTTIIMAKMFEAMDDVFDTKDKSIRHRTLPENILGNKAGKTGKVPNTLMKTVENAVGTKKVPIVEKRR